MLSKAPPTLIVLVKRQRPISIWRSSGWAWYQAVAPSGSRFAGMTQRGSFGSIASSGESQAMSS